MITVIVQDKADGGETVIVRGPEGADGVGIPAGGTAGQALLKASSTDYDTEWGDVEGGGGSGVSDHGLLSGLTDDDHTQYAKKASNLSDLTSAATARTNLGLGTAATQASGAFDAAGTAAAAVAAHEADAVDAHDASAISFSPAGSIAATDVQAAVAEVATDAASALSTHEADTTSVHGIADTSALLTDSDIASGGVAPFEQTINTQTASYTLVLSDNGKVVEMNAAGANNLTVPANASVAFPVGTRIDVVQIGAGQTTLVEDTGVTINSLDGNLNISGQYAGCTLYKRATNEWVAIGSLVV